MKLLLIVYFLNNMLSNNVTKIITNDKIKNYIKI